MIIILVNNIINKIQKRSHITFNDDQSKLTQNPTNANNNNYGYRNSAINQNTEPLKSKYNYEYGEGKKSYPQTEMKQSYKNPNITINYVNPNSNNNNSLSNTTNFYQEKNSSFNNPPFTFDNRAVQFMIDNSMPHQNQHQNIQRKHIFNRSSMSKRKRLKIFPQSPPKQKSIVKEISPPIVQVQNKSELQRLNKEVTQIKNQLKFFQSRQASHNTSARLSQQVIDLSKLQFQRTKRLNLLNQQNQSLYNKLAFKLKQVAGEQYRMYLEQTSKNRSFLNQIFEHSKSRSKPSKQKDPSLYHHKDFIDIGQFQAEYERKYTEAKNTPQKFSPSKSSQKKQKYEYQQIQNIIQGQKFQKHSKQPLSPFAVKQNQHFSEKSPKVFVFPEQIEQKKQNNSQSYTFNKGKYYETKQFQRTSHLNQMTPFQSTIKQKIPDRNIEQKAKQYQAARNSSRVQKKRLQIHDLNRKLQEKNMRKRIQSQYLKGRRVIM